MAKSKGRGKRKKKSPFSLDRGLVSVLLSIVTLALLGTALITESILLLVVSALSGLATAAQIRWSQKRTENDLRKAAARPRAKTTRTPRPAPPESDGEPVGEAVPNGGAVMCTDTGRPVSDCDCASRHVATTDGAHRYGLPVGSPMGRRKKAAKPAGTVRS